MNETTAEAMASLEEQKKELDAAIQAERVKATLFEDEASIKAFYQRFAHATMDTQHMADLRVVLNHVKDADSRAAVIESTRVNFHHFTRIIEQV